jgi:hypothetical protein
LVAACLLLAGVGSAAQPPVIPPQQPRVTDKPKPPEPPAVAKVLSAQKVDELIEKAFGRDCAELKAHRSATGAAEDAGEVAAADE